MCSSDLVPLYSVIQDKKSDVAIFDLSKTPKLCKKYCNNLSLDDLMTKNKLYPGMKVFWDGSPNLKNGFYRESQITTLGIRNLTNYKIKNSFLIQDKVISGTSGKPLWNDDDGLKIVGAAKYAWNSFGGFGFMDSYIRAIKKYESSKEIGRAHV